jgi:hypothetical protein
VQVYASQQQIHFFSRKSAAVVRANQCNGSRFFPA